MWMGSPPLTVSVEKTLRKSWGVNFSGVPSASAIWARFARPASSSRMRSGGMTCSRWCVTRWNRCGSEGPKVRS
jgi:hypothetical protein